MKALAATQNDAQAWDKYREELNDTGSLEFEGDPGLEWFTAHPAPSADTATNLPALLADKRRYDYISSKLRYYGKRTGSKDGDFAYISMEVPLDEFAKDGLIAGIDAASKAEGRS